MRRLDDSNSSRALSGSRLSRPGAAQKRARRTATKQIGLLFLLLLGIHLGLGATASANPRSRDPIEEAIAEWEAHGATPESVSEAGLPIAAMPPPQSPSLLHGEEGPLSSSSSTTPTSGAEASHDSQPVPTSQASPGVLSGGTGRVTGSAVVSGNGTVAGAPAVQSDTQADADSPDEEDDESSEAEAGATPEWHKRSPGRGPVWERLENRFEIWLQKVFDSEGPKRRCKETKKAGQTPSAINGDSPVKTFGYPQFGENGAFAWLEKRQALSVVAGHPEAIRVGAEDYYVQGTYDELSAFLECFSRYEVIGTKLTPEGHWTADRHYGPLYVQIENTRADLRSPFGDAASPLFRYGFAYFLRVIWKRTKKLRVGSFDRALKKVAAMRSLNQFLPVVSHEDLLADWNRIERVGTRLGQTRAVVHAVNRSHKRLRLDDEEGWIDLDNIDVSAPLTLSITSYPRPSQGVRATLVMPSSTATLAGLRDKLSWLFETSFVGVGVREFDNEDVEEPDYLHNTAL